MKHFNTINNQGSIVGVTCRGRSSSTSTDNVYAELHDDYGVKTTAITRRTGWLDRGRGRSSSTLTRIDPLWAHNGRGRNTSTPTYAYSTANPINLVDPWGLKGGGGSGSGNTENGGGSKPQLGEDNETTTAPVIENSERAEGRLWFESIWRSSLSPGMAWSGSSVAPHPVLTGQNDQRALGPMGFGWKGKAAAGENTSAYATYSLRVANGPVLQTLRMVTFIAPRWTEEDEIAMRVASYNRSSKNAVLLSLSGSFVPVMGISYGISVSLDHKGNVDWYFDLSASLGLSLGIDVAVTSVEYESPSMPYSVDYSASVGPLNASFQIDRTSGLPIVFQPKSAGASVWGYGFVGPTISLGQHWLLGKHRNN